MRKDKMIRRLLFTLGIILALIFIFPILILANCSMKSLQEIYLNTIGLPSRLDFSNYKTAFFEMDFIRTIINSIAITAISTVGILLVSSMAAWVLVRYKSRESNIIFMIFAAAQLIPFQCVMLPLVRFMNVLGLMNRHGIIFMYVGFGCSLTIVFLHGFVKNVPIELEESATIDGCNMLQTFFLIVVPLLKVALVTVAIINVMWIWNDFLLPQLVINKPGWQTLPLKTYMFFGQYTRKWDIATAALILCLLPIVIFYLFCQKYIVQGVIAGAVK